jgi:hypothetical protein
LTHVPLAAAASWSHALIGGVAVIFLVVAVLLGVILPL